MTTPAGIKALSGPEARLGLRPGQVELVEHNAHWRGLFEGLAAQIAEVLGGLDAQIEHVGSTSVPGLPAKPLLDIAIGIAPPIDNDDVITRLATAGLHFELDLGMYGGLFFTIANDADLVVVHVHVVATNDFQWRWYRAFRDGLRSDPELRREYADLKRAAASAHAADREAYTEAKFEWVLATVNSLTAD